MPDAIEPAAEEFFASPGGVCVYVYVGGQAIRVQFDSPDGQAVAQRAPDAGAEQAGAEQAGAEQALAAATTARDKHKVLLAPLFELVAAELVSRTRA